jgi:creatinine amidohydrolase
MTSESFQPAKFRFRRQLNVEISSAVWPSKFLDTHWIRFVFHFSSSAPTENVAKAIMIPTSSTSPFPTLLSEANLAQVRVANYQVAILPFGATEPHNLHLPYGTDVFEADWIAAESARRASELGAKVVVLPTIPYGTESNLAGFPLAMNLQPTTLLAVIRDLVESISQAGIRKIVILNSHGGNDFKPFLRELYGRTDAHLFLCNWYQMVRDLVGKICEHPDDHAGEMETSLILAYRPELVARKTDGGLTADAGSTRPLRFQALREGWVGMTRRWTLLTTNSGSGNPHSATAEKGQAILDAICSRFVPFLVELSNSPLDDAFPFEV